MLTTLRLNGPENQTRAAAEVRSKEPAPPAPVAGRKSSRIGSRVLRFAKSERLVHWSIAGPFLVSYASGMTLALIYNPDPTRPLRCVFAALHRASGVALIVFPMLATFRARRDFTLHFYNIRQAWIWVYDDFKWLALMGLAALNSSIKLPEQGKFNAAEKLNFMVLMTTYPLYVATGLLMWLTHLAVLSWIMHFCMATLATPLLVGHLFMALINRETRVGLDGMFSGFVERQWAKHHYRRWYREHHEATEHSPAVEEVEEPRPAAPPAQPSPAARGKRHGPGIPEHIGSVTISDLGGF